MAVVAAIQQVIAEYADRIYHKMEPLVCHNALPISPIGTVFQQILEWMANILAKIDF